MKLKIFSDPRVPGKALWLTLVAFTALSSVHGGGSFVTVVEQGDGFQLLRNGEPYFIKGAGGQDHLDRLAEAGGNSIRTWGADGIGTLLDDAHELGLTVTVGFWLGHERHGFRYSDVAMVREQFEKCRRIVRQYKDHPALLMWAIGNEMEGDGTDPAIWESVEAIAAMCKEEDPNHPTMTVTADLGADGINVRMLNRHCPSIDIHGVNSYRGLMTLRRRYAGAGGTRPVIVTEFGPLGHWETPKTEWGAPLEQNSTAKAETCRQSYLAFVVDNPICLGSYVFLWGNKMEVTETWFSMILRGGYATRSVDVMTELWTGEEPLNRAPEIGDLELSQDRGLKPGDEVRATVVVSDPDGDELDVQWRLLGDRVHLPVGGDFQTDEPVFPDAMVYSDRGEARVRIPASGGGYRLMAYAFDGKGKVATANAPLFVEGEVIPLPAPPVGMPFPVYRESDGSQPYVPSGFMGNHAAISMDTGWTENPFSGRTCLKFTYGAADGWGGVVWQSPPNDWGDRPGGYNLSKATHLRFAARGESGGERIGVAVGILGEEKAYPDSSITRLDNLRLSREWETFSIPLEGKDLSMIKSGFHWHAPAQGEAFTFYLDEIEFVAE